MSGSQSLQRLIPKDRAFARQFGTPERILSRADVSAVFVKKLLAVAVSNIAYLRDVFPESSFEDRYVDDLHLKMLCNGKRNCPQAQLLVQQMKGCFEAVDRKYLKEFSFWFFRDSNRPEEVLEAYVFTVDYVDAAAALTLNVNGSPSSRAVSSENFISATVTFMKSLIEVVEALDPLPMSVPFRVRLGLDETRAPRDFAVPHFIADGPRLILPRRLSAANLSTNHHGLSVIVTSELHPEFAKKVRVIVAEEKRFGDEREDVDKTSLTQEDTLDTSEPSQDSRASIDCSQNRMSCVCFGGPDGRMLRCSVCCRLQHQLCYGIFSDSDFEGDHVCVRCVERTGVSPRRCLDRGLLTRSPRSAMIEGSWRRTLGVAAEVECLNVRHLKHRLGFARDVAEVMIWRLVSQKLASRVETGRGERGAVELEYKIDQTALKIKLDAARQASERWRHPGSQTEVPEAESNPAVETSDRGAKSATPQPRNDKLAPSQGKRGSSQLGQFSSRITKRQRRGE